MSDRFDELLNKVLHDESAAEPLAGLEQRVMARVREVSAPASRRWMFAAWAGGLGVAAVVALVVLLPGRHEVRTVRHDGLAVSAGDAVPSGAKAPSAGTMYGTRSASLRAGSEAVPLSKTGSLPDDVSRGVRAERAVASRRSGAGGKQAVQAEDAAVSKLEVFPSPAPADVFPTPVAGDERQDAAMISPKAAEALLALQKEQAGPIQIAAIVIAPLNPER